MESNVLGMFFLFFYYGLIENTCSWILAGWIIEVSMPKSQCFSWLVRRPN